jgi:hypothetical protein
MGLVPYGTDPKQLANFSPSPPDQGSVSVAGADKGINITNGQIPVTGVAYLSGAVADTLILKEP